MLYATSEPRTTGRALHNIARQPVNLKPVNLATELYVLHMLLLVLENVCILIFALNDIIIKIFFRSTFDLFKIVYSAMTFML